MAPDRSPDVVQAILACPHTGWSLALDRAVAIYVYVVHYVIDGRPETYERREYVPLPAGGSVPDALKPLLEASARQAVWVYLDGCLGRGQALAVWPSYKEHHGDRA